MSDEQIYRGWDVVGRLGRSVRRSISNVAKAGEAQSVDALADGVAHKLAALSLDDEEGRRHLAANMSRDILESLAPDCEDVESLPYFDRLAGVLFALIEYEQLFALPEGLSGSHRTARSEVWDAEHQVRRVEKITDQLDDAIGDLARMVGLAIEPIFKKVPTLLEAQGDGSADNITFTTPLSQVVVDLPEIVEQMVQLPFAPELEEHESTANSKARLKYNLLVASGAVPDDPRTHPRHYRLPTKAPAMANENLIKTYLDGTPLALLFDFDVPITIPEKTRFEHHMIVSGSGHGKTQTLQHMILHDLDAVARGEASIVVIDSQSDLINTIAGLSLFSPGQPLADRLVLIDPTDVEWPVALNLFDVGMERINQYSQLDRERLINGILELYDFVLGSLLDAGMTQKQSVIFRYITRLMLHIPDATIHTFRELLEDDGFDRHYEHIKKLEGSARAFFENEFRSREFVSTRRQVLRRLYGVLENQSFERMFSHPRSKVDLFSEMNAGKVILINTAKDLLKENGTEIFGRFFIAMIAQAAQERAVLPKEKRTPTFVVIDEASDYFDRNIGIILSQARKFSVGMTCAFQYLGQVDTKLQEAMFANTSIKFAGGVSAKDARTLAADMRTDAAFLEERDVLSFAAFVKGTTKQAVSVSIPAGQMEALPRMSEEVQDAQRDRMRANYAVHYTAARKPPDQSEEAPSDKGPIDPDNHEPTAWT